MPALNQTARDQILYLFDEEISMLKGRVMEVYTGHQAAASREVSKRQGLNDELRRLDDIEEEIKNLEAERDLLKSKHEWRQETPTLLDWNEAGFSVRELHPYTGKPVPPVKMLGHEISTRWDLEVFKVLNEQYDLIKIDKAISGVDHAVRREIALAGNYEQARKAYESFYSLLKSAMGDETPPLLTEILDLPDVTALTPALKDGNNKE